MIEQNSSFICLYIRIEDENKTQAAQEKFIEVFRKKDYKKVLRSRIEPG